MIPKEAFIAISLIMGVSCAFGYVLRGIVDNARKTESEWFMDGLSADHDRWENDPEPTRECYTCKFIHKPTMLEPCVNCHSFDKWEAKG